MSWLDDIVTRAVQQALGILNVQDNGNLGSAALLDFTTYSRRKGVLNANCTLTATWPARAGELLVWLTQDGTGSRTVTWPSAVRWAGGTAPTLTTTAGRTDLFRFHWDGSRAIGETVALNINLT